ncbi:kinase-like domain-containing protein [Chytriomyces sp. MP71]|nr:kinase-like domain-containing protein [Chytriomyces sp. MP71]
MLGKEMKSPTVSSSHLASEADIRAKIAVEMKVRDGASAMYRQMSDPVLRMAVEQNLVESEQRLAYLSQLLASLSLGQAAKEEAQAATPLSAHSHSQSHSRSNSLNQINMCAFDLLKYSKTITTEKINYRFAEIRKKMATELKIKAGTEGLLVATQSYNTAPASPADPLSSANSNAIAAANISVSEESRLEQDLRAQISESNSKITVLEKARQRYVTLSVLPLDDVITVADEEEDSAAEMNSRGRLRMKIVGASNLVGRTAVANEIQARVSLDGNVKFTSKKCSRHWNESLDFQVERLGQEVEICVYSDGGVDGMRLLGLTWFKLGDLAADLKVRYPEGNAPENVDDAEDTWLDLEPAGQILIRTSFVSTKDKTKKQKKDAVFRKEAVQKAFPRNGHMFYAFQSILYQCAVCNEYAGSGRQWYRCQGCNYTCHAKCYPNVLTKCITLDDIKRAKSNDDLNTGQLLPSYRIPHRFNQRLMPLHSWCAHCGAIIAPGRWVEKCVDCGKCSHTACRPFMPTFCQLKPEVAITLMTALEDVERRRHLKELESAERGRVVSGSPPVVGEEGGASGVSTPNIASGDAISGSGTPELSTGGRFEIKRKSVPLLSIMGKIQLEDFEMLSVIGRGAFGKVMLIEEKSTKKLYAMKALKKEHLIEQDDVVSSRLEKLVFQKASQAQHPFLVNLHSCFQTDTRLFYVMEYIPGGDLMGHIMQKKRFSPELSKFYAAEICLALEFLHKHAIVYRDLKLENILLCADGHVKLTDFGISKDNMPYGQLTKTYCGTPDFMAPEILNKRKYGRSVDWWSFGVMIYVMMTGRYPFSGEDEREILKSIYTDEIDFPHFFTPETVGLIKGLLHKDPHKRFGGARQGASEVKRQKYFADTNWEHLMERKAVPPWKPRIDDEKDVSNFDAEFTDERPVLTPITSVLSAVEQNDFKGFDFVADFAGLKT